LNNHNESEKHKHLLEESIITQEESNTQKQSWFNKRKNVLFAVVGILVVLVLGVLISSIMKPNKMSGCYELTTVSLNDRKMSLNELDFTGELDVAGIDNNSISGLFFSGSSTQDLTTGYITGVLKGNDYVKYKFWVVSHQGNFLTDGMDYFYIYFYPKENQVMIDGGEMKLYFEK